MAHRTASLTAEVQLHEVLRLRLHRGALFVRERYQTALRQIPELAYGGIARELRDVFEDAGDTPDVSLLHVEVERPRDGILAVGDRVEVRHHAVDVRALDFVDRKSTRLNSSHSQISYAVFCLKKKKK